MGVERSNKFWNLFIQKFLITKRYLWIIGDVNKELNKRGIWIMKMEHVDPVIWAFHSGKNKKWESEFFSWLFVEREALHPELELGHGVRNGTWASKMPPYQLPCILDSSINRWDCPALQFAYRLYLLKAGSRDSAKGSASWGHDQVGQSFIAS